MASKRFETERKQALKRLAHRPVGPEELAAIVERHAATKKICNASRDTMVVWVLKEKDEGRMYATMEQAIPAFVAYLVAQGWTEEQAQKIAARASE